MIVIILDLTADGGVIVLICVFDKFWLRLTVTDTEFLENFWIKISASVAL